ncbi:ABC transporter ATP-binding protein [Pseudomonas chlororaphis]|uniref:ABC transporter ATP-binding protein n=1 Tax=Pseudomonas chlororaphis TaxID=587753 RepID=UPI00352AA2FB
MFAFFEKVIDPFKSEFLVARVKGPVSLYVAYLSKFKWLFCVLVFAVSMNSLIEISIFRYLGAISDALLQGGKGEVFATQGVSLGLLFLALVLLKPGANLIRALLLNQALRPHLTNMIRWHAHNGSVDHSLSFFDNGKVGSLGGRVMQLGAAVSESIILFLETGLHIFLYFSITFFLFFTLAWQLLSVLVVWLVAYVAILIVFTPKLRRRMQASVASRSDLMGALVDIYSNMKLVKIYGSDHRETEYAKSSIASSIEAVAHSTRIVTAMDAFLSLINGLLIFCTIAVSLFLWREGTITGGAIVLAAGLVVRIYNLSTFFMWTSNSLVDLYASVRDSYQFLPDIVGARQQRASVELADLDVVFDSVCFSYGNNSSALTDLSLHIKEGEHIGIVGASGVGKSTIINLLLGLYDVTSGSISVGGHDIRNYSADTFLKKIGYVSQDAMFFNRSLRDNLRYGRPEATDDEIYQALIQAQADTFVESLTDAQGRRGLDAFVGERGAKLSGGQRQRLSIARVILKQPEIFIFDEATSALDADVENSIHRNLAISTRGKTSITITHRLSAMRAMDRVYVIHEGRVHEVGTHADLLALDGLYAHLWASQV